VYSRHRAGAVQATAGIVARTHEKILVRQSNGVGERRDVHHFDNRKTVVHRQGRLNTRPTIGK